MILTYFSSSHNANIGSASSPIAAPDRSIPAVPCAEFPVFVDTTDVVVEGNPIAFEIDGPLVVDPELTDPAPTPGPAVIVAVRNTISLPDTIVDVVVDEAAGVVNGPVSVLVSMN